jgi:hypothetical protein
MTFHIYGLAADEARLLTLTEPEASSFKTA